MDDNKRVLILVDDLKAFENLKSEYFAAYKDSTKLTMYSYETNFELRLLVQDSDMLALKGKSNNYKKVILYLSQDKLEKLQDFIEEIKAYENSELSPQDTIH